MVCYWKAVAQYLTATAMSDLGRARLQLSTNRWRLRKNLELGKYCSCSVSCRQRLLHFPRQSQSCRNEGRRAGYQHISRRLSYWPRGNTLVGCTDTEGVHKFCLARSQIAQQKICSTIQSTATHQLVQTHVLFDGCAGDCDALQTKRLA